MRAYEFGFDVDARIPDKAVYVAIPANFDYTTATAYTWSADPGYMFQWYIPGVLDILMDALVEERLRYLDNQILGRMREIAGLPPIPPDPPEPETQVFL